MAVRGPACGPAIPVLEEENGRCVHYLDSLFENYQYNIVPMYVKVMIPMYVLTRL